ncbi:hypothetical protein [Arthrobacter sp. Ld5]|uniref:hypothetical protein n=1 Tax=Arthrobacter sp. Ld5 TaxID=649152 RepID=UPI003EBBBBDE
MIIRSVDISDERILADAYKVECAANAKARPKWIGRGVEARILGWRAEDGWAKHLLESWDSAELQGFVASRASEGEPGTGTTWIFPWAHPRYEGKGVGAGLMRAAEDDWPSTTTRFIASAYRPALEAIAALVERFLTPLGYTVATTETVVDLDLESFGSAARPAGRAIQHSHPHQRCARSSP